MTTDNANISTLETLAARVDRVERSAKRWRFGAVGLAAVLCCVVGMGAAEAAKVTTFDTVKAKAFEVVDEKGKSIGKFIGVKADGGDGLQCLLVVTQSDQKAYTMLKPGSEPTFDDFQQ
ncbi:MAG: hypothetical protein QM775_27790 [Pirellulales bacterium]